MFSQNHNTSLLWILLQNGEGADNESEGKTINIIGVY